MKRVLFLLIFIGFSLSLVAQNITVVEYFFDTDPGYGSGTSVSITPAPALTNLSFNINISAQSDGFHTLFVRAKDATNNWSAAYSRPFYKLSAAMVAPTAPNINKVEYFFDTDPGYGAGTNVPVTPAVSITDQNFTIPLGSTADGFHTIFLRTRDANNNWSAAYSRPFYKLSASAVAAVPNLNKLEYFIDADPGYGAGVNVPITTGVAVTDLTVPISVTAIAEGSHIITFRARDANNNWSVVAIKNFSKCNHPGTTINAATSITSSGFTASWADVPGSISYQLDVSADNFTTFVSGYNSKVITAPALSAAVTGLTQATAYKYRVRAVAGCASVESNAINLNTLATPPTAQPTNLLFSSVTATSFTAFFTAPATAPTGYLVVRKAASSSTFVPVNNTTYTVGQTVGDGVVAYIGSTFLFNQSGLSANTRYHYDVFAYNQINGFTTYLTASPLENNVSTVALEPTAQPTALQFSSVTAISYTVSYTIASGNPDGYLVLRKTGSAPTSIPVDGTTYTTTVGTDAVVYNGAAITFAQSGLTQNTEYFYAVYAYNGNGSSINYRTVSPLQGSQLTPITAPTATASNLLFSNVTPASLTVSYTAATGSPSGYLVIRKTGSSPAFIPQQNTTYTQGQTVSDGVVAYVGTALTFNESGLTASTAYFYDVFAYNQNGSLISYQTIAPLEGSKTTFTAEPTAQPSAIVFSDVTTTSITLSFRAASPAPSGYIALRKVTSAPTSLPVDGAAYTVSQTLGDATVAYVGAAVTFVDGGLVPGTTYYYQLFAYNGSSDATNYLTTLNTSNAGSKITIPDKPVLTAATGIQQNQFTINWTTVVGATNYRLDVSKDNFVSKVSGFDDVTVSGTSALVNGLENGVAYKYRLRAVNASGTSANSDESQQFTIPATPILAVASDVTQTSFKVNWTLVPGATGYFIDVSDKSDFTTFVTGYQNKTLANTTSETITTLTPGTIYYYRIRSSNTGGTSPSSVNGSQLLLPATPVGLDATNTTSTSFKAKWQAVAGVVDEYRIDVTLASNNFNPSLPDFINKVVIGNVEELIVNLLPNTAYRYRIRAVNVSGTSPNSASISVSTTPPGTGLELDLTNLVSSLSNASIEVKGGNPPYTMSFYYRKITASDFTVRPLTSSSATYQTAIDASMMDELGVEFYFKVTDANGTSDESEKGYIYKTITTAGEKIPFIKSGGVAESYEIFSIPYAISNDLVGQIFEEMGGIDKTKWRLVRYQGGKNVDLSESSKIEPGKGYWFNRKEATVVNFTGGTVVKNNQSVPFILQLEKGWNQIGNPFLFKVDWDDILAANPSLNSIGTLHVFNPTGLHLNDVSNNLEAWSGGFVFNSSEQNVELQLPVTLKNTAGSRKSSATSFSNRIDQPEWLVPITISQGESITTVSAIGMHPEASASIDRYDAIVVPRFLNYLEFYSRHDEFFSPKFSSDVIPTGNNFTWNIQFESNVKQVGATLQWDNTALGNNEAALLLFDVTHNAIINMKTTNSYAFKPEASQQFKIFYGRNSKELQPDINMLGYAYPNPFATGSSATIPFIIRQAESRVVVSVMDMMGKPVVQLINAVHPSGVHQTTWNGTDALGEQVAQGMYIYQLEVDGHVMTGRVVKK